MYMCILCVLQPMYEATNIKPQYSTTTVVTRVNNQPINGAANSRTSLSNNLSELDTLLDELSSAQFIAEVDRRHSGCKNSLEGRGRTCKSMFTVIFSNVPDFTIVNVYSDLHV